MNKIQMLTATFFIVNILLFMISVSYGITDIQNYLPPSWDENTDLKPYIQTAFDTEDVRFSGSGNPSLPLIYPSTAGLEIPEGRKVVIAADAQLKRLPSKGVFLTMFRFAELSCDGFGFYKGRIDGNKAAHWPDYPDMGHFNGAAILIRADAVNCTIKKIHVFDCAGIGFAIFGSFNLVDQCKAENIGYLDLKFGINYYDGALDAWSGDGFTVGDWGAHDNTIMNCESVDAFRWDFTPSHLAYNNTFIDCTGRDVRWKSYGFVDAEDTLAVGNNVFIRCHNLGSSGNNGNRTTFPNGRNVSFEDCDLGDSIVEAWANFPGCKLKNVSMSSILFGGYYTVASWYGDITMTGTINIHGPIVIENGGFDIIQSDGVINVYGSIKDEAGYYPEDNTTYGITQNDGVMNVSGEMVLGYRQAITGTHNLSGGILNLHGTESPEWLIYGRSGTGIINISQGSSITEDIGASIPMVLRWNSEGSGTLQGYGTVGLTGWFVNNGKVIADGQGRENTLDLSSFSSVNNHYSFGQNGSGAPSDITNTSDNGWYAINKGKLVLPKIAVGNGNVSVNWAERPIDTVIDLINSVKMTFLDATAGDLDISLIAPDREEVSGNLWSIGVWDVNYSGSCDAVEITFRYDDSEAVDRGILENELKVYQQSSGSFVWKDVTGNIDTANKHITTGLVCPFTNSKFAVGVVPENCGEPGTYYLKYDLNGHGGVSDCYVDFIDFTSFALYWLCEEPYCYEIFDLSGLAEQWLSCTDPANSDCR